MLYAQGHSLSPKLSPFFLAFLLLLFYCLERTMNRFGLHVGGNGFSEFWLCLSGYKAEVMGNIETMQDPES